MDFLKTLHVHASNYGANTGRKWIISKGETLHSYSPVDGKLIGSVTMADKESYEKCLLERKELLSNGGWCPRPNAEK